MNQSTRQDILRDLQLTNAQVHAMVQRQQDLEVEVRYTVSQAGFCVSPGPFGVSPITGYITGYRLPEYPARLDPVILPYFVSPGA